MANTKKRWTTEEIEILKKHYPTEGDAVFKRLPGRTAKSCRIPQIFDSNGNVHYCPLLHNIL